MITLSSPLETLKGVGPKFGERLRRFGIATVKDLLWHFPSRYEDFSAIRKISALAVGENATIEGVISAVKLHRTWRRRMFIVEVLVADGTGTIQAVWFNQRFLLSIFKKGKAVRLAGKVVSDPERGICLTHPIYEMANGADNDDATHTGRLVPIYPETRRITSKALRYLIKPILDELETLQDAIPASVRAARRLPEVGDALRQIHFPETLAEAHAAKRRFTFEDLFFLQLLNVRERLRLAGEKAYACAADAQFIRSSLQKLPFELTGSQKKVLEEIRNDLGRSRPMNRLLQGDVGSGKTIVAALAALIVARENCQSAFMAPTEVLARQHYETFKKFFNELNCGIGLLTSGEARMHYGDGLESDVKKKDFAERVRTNEIKIIFGTHALIQKSITFHNLAFVVVDEQHRFGVRQRAELLDKTPAQTPHFLSMSATPIPRTLSLTIFGDLDLSIIDELPKGRREIITKIVAPANRVKAYAFIRGQVHRGRQAFVICPRIEKPDEEENGAEEGAMRRTSRLLALEVKNVKEEYEKLNTKVFPDLRVAMLHGKMKSKEKEEIMRTFKEGAYDVLVSTSVVEVGVDVPNATIMMIEGSERFGLSQLYQFRGRVGRGEHQSFCFLFTDTSGKQTHERLHALLHAKNGFELAEKDLAIRGPGEFLGVSQTGVPDLAMKALRNPELVAASRAAAEEILKDDPHLERHLLLRDRLASFEAQVHLE